MTVESNITARDRWAKWERENPEKAAAAETLHKLNAGKRSANRRRAHPEKVREANAKWERENRQRRHELDRRKRTKNPEKYRALSAKGKAKWKLENPEKYKKLRFAIKKKYYYGLNYDQWNLLFDSQGNRCAICKTDNPEKYWHTDHCHATKVVRGILCRSCNHMLGFAKDQPNILKKGAAYLKRAMTQRLRTNTANRLNME